MPDKPPRHRWDSSYQPTAAFAALGLFVAAMALSVCLPQPAQAESASSSSNKVPKRVPLSRKKSRFVQVVDVASADPPDRYMAKEISNLELKCFGRQYHGSMDDRLERMEVHIFGMAKLGDIQSRIDSIKETLKLASSADKSNLATAPAAVGPDAANLTPEDLYNSSTPEDLGKELNSLEIKCFGREYHNKPLEDRLENMEELLFGMAKAGGEKTRLASIKQAVDEQEGDAPAPASAAAKPKKLDAIGQLEEKYYKDDFSTESDDERLMRLEELVFGQARHGDARSRLKELKKAIANTEAESADALAASKARGDDPNDMVHDKNPNFAVAMSTGINNFKLRRFHHAQEDFEQAIHFKPQSPEAYTNLGSTLMALRDFDGAQEAFKASFTLEPFGPLGQYTHKQMLNIAQEQAYLNTDPQDSPKFVAQMLRDTNRQAADAAARYQKEADISARHRLRMGQLEAMRITMNLNGGGGNFQRALSPYGSGGGGGGYYGGGHYGGHYGGGYYTGRANYGGGYYGGGGYGGGYRSGYNSGNAEISNLAAIRRNYVLTDSRVQANRARILGQQKSASAYGWGASLKDQILQMHYLPGDAHLKALGTNLYVQYYGNGMPSFDDELTMFDPPLPALHAVAEELHKPHSASD